MSDDRKEFISGLRWLAAFYDANPNLKTPSALTINVWAADKAELTKFAISGGKWNKVFAGGYFWVSRIFGNITLEVNIPRSEVCRQVETGTRIIPARPAEPEREEPIYEWVCDASPLLSEKE